MAGFVYIVECADGTFYTGWTKDLDKRIAMHNHGKGAKYTQPRCPVVLRYWEKFASREEAMRRECSIKRMTRKQKMELIAGTHQWAIGDRETCKR